MRLIALAWTAALLAGCGGAADIDNPEGASGQKLAFAYFQKCVQPLLSSPLTLPGGGTATCAAGGCHDNTNGTGGALRLIGNAATVDLGLTADEIRASQMYRNFYSAQGVTVPGNPEGSRLLAKPLLLGMLHGGGQVLGSADDELALRIRYWITHPAPKDQDEFSSATYAMFTPADPATGSCNTR
ncbi:hypothetical protein KAK07_11170 [Ideonella sp. 4Y16]|uniref:Lipoprotein n=1 Tax=Ideonella alba TaxID=2824118 RepID=A0A940Y9Y7_9BURK|nr:hypothetical protein [Ideonella alba]MBQ0931588.1 hypothetical protein [Ideonella alba]MBQ0943894.1 hypothetical protein [Ideonella alba]